MIDGRTIALVDRLWRQHRVTLGVLAAGLAGFAFVITRVAPTPGDVGFLGGLMALLPPQIAELAGGQLALASPRGVIAFGYLHPFFLALLSAWTIRVSAGALAGEIGRGTMDLLAARPVSRAAQVMAAWVAMTAGSAALAAAAWTGTAVGLGLRSLGVSGADVSVLPVMTWLLFAAWGSVALLVSATRREAGSAIAWTSGFIATAFVLEFLARVWSPIGWARPLSLFAYYRPPELLQQGVHLTDALVLAGVTVAALSAAVLVFRRRDL